MWLSEKWVCSFSVVLLAVVLSACGGGGSSDGGGSTGGGGGSTGGDDDPVPGEQSPASPEVSLTIDAVKTFRFDWADVADATAYRLLENPDGMSGFAPVGEDIEPGTETLELTVPLYERVNAQYILQACNAAGCSDSEALFVSGNLASGIGYFKASNTNTEDLFGAAVSLSADGQTMAVGARSEDSNATGVNGNQNNNLADRSGAVYVFARQAGTWQQQAYLKASNPGGYDDFGVRVSLSADGYTLAVGAPGEDSDANGVNGDQNDNSAVFAGAVYVFTRNEADTWSQQAYLKASNSGEQDKFGSALSLSANGYTLAVGAPGEDSNATGVDAVQCDINGLNCNNSAAGAGAVYVFARQAGTWQQQAYLKASNTQRLDSFGIAVSLSAEGNTLAVGAGGEDSAAIGINGDQNSDDATDSGAVYVFTREVTTSTWSQQAYVKASNTDAYDQFGFAVSLSADGHTLAVSAAGEDSVATDVNGDQTDNSVNDAGAVYVFARDASAWSQQAYLKASNTDADDRFGGTTIMYGSVPISLSADGQTLAVGAYKEDADAMGVDGEQSDNSATSAGAVYVFARDEADIWSRKAYLKALNTGPDDQFGVAVSLSADGQALAVGAIGEDSPAIGVNGDPGDSPASTASGAVYLY